MDIKGIRGGIVSMADKVGEMIDLVEEGFMKNKMELLTVAMQKEDEINKMEKSLMEEILKLSMKTKDKGELSNLSQVVEMLERMGDEASALIERIEVKVAEKLLFAEEAVKQFNETYAAMKDSVVMMKRCLGAKDPALKDKVIENGFRVKGLVEQYRKEHADRLVRGECTPMGANMYSDMLDFTGNLARHSSNIVKLQ